MRRPGERLRSLAALVCDVTTMERLIDPVIADMQCEHTDASNRGSGWRRARVRIAGSLAFWLVIGALAIERLVDRAHHWLTADDWAMGRTLGFMAIVTAAVTLLLAVVVFQNAPEGPFNRAESARLVLYLVPQAIPIAVSAGLLIGIVHGLRGRTVTSRVRRAIVLVAMCCALAAIAWDDRVVPEANQAFRVVASGIPYNRLAKGANELTFGELAKKIAESDGHSLESSPERAILRFSYHGRLAVSITPFIVGLFALGLAASDRRRLPLAISVLAMTAYVGYYLAYDFTQLIESNHWGAAIAVSIAWFPNLLFLLGTLLLKKRSHAAALLTRSG
jgi:uncharacterized membrane protein